MPSYTKDPRHYLASLPSSSWSHRRAGQKGHLPMLFGITMSRAFTWILFQASRCSLRSTNSTAIADGRASRNLSNPKMWSSSLTTATAWPESGVRSSHADSHLAIPQDAGGLRYCINSASLRFVPIDELENEDYGDYLRLFEPKGEK